MKPIDEYPHYFLFFSIRLSCAKSIGWDPEIPNEGEWGPCHIWDHGNAAASIPILENCLATLTAKFQSILTVWLADKLERSARRAWYPRAFAELRRAWKFNSVRVVLAEDEKERSARDRFAWKKQFASCHRWDRFLCRILPISTPTEPRATLLSVITSSTCVYLCNV